MSGLEIIIWSSVAIILSATFLFWRSIRNLCRECREEREEQYKKSNELHIQYEKERLARKKEWEDMINERKGSKL